MVAAEARRWEALEARLGVVPPSSSVVQRKATGSAEPVADALAVAAAATRGPGGALPHQARIQASFGRHDVSFIRAFRGVGTHGAMQALGARAFAHGDAVAFHGDPDLHTAAHEAAHVIQQRAGVQLAGNLDETGDRFERHADAVADRVVAGQSAEALLDQVVGHRGSNPAVQRKAGDTPPAKDRAPHLPDGVNLQILSDGSVIVRTAWVEAAPDKVVVAEGVQAPSVITTILHALKDAGVLSWVPDAEIEHYATSLVLQGTYNAKVQPFHQLGIAFSVYVRVGPPPGVNILFTRNGRGLLGILRQSALIPGPIVAETEVELSAPVRNELWTALEQFTGMPLAPAVKAALIHDPEPWKPRVRPGQEGLAFPLEPATLERLYGQQRWNDHLAVRHDEHRPPLGKAAPTGHKPLFNEPVRGQIVNRGGLTYVGQDTEFSFETENQRRASAVPYVDVRWVLTRKDRPTEHLKEGKTRHIEREKPDPFSYAWKATGLYTVRAFVAHTFYQPAHFAIEVEVKTEQARAKELSDTAFHGLHGSKTHETGPTDWPFDVSWFNTVFGSHKEEYGKKTSGTTPEDFKRMTYEERVKFLATDKQRLKDMIAAHTNARGEPSDARWADMVAYARDKLKTLDETEQTLAMECAAGDVFFEARASFLSRKNGIPDQTLKLLGLAKKERDGIKTTVHDFTQLYEPSDYTFSATGTTFDKSIEATFVDLVKSYPPGRISCLFEALDDRLTPTRRTIGFELDTGTAWKDVKGVVYNPAVMTVVNIVGAATMVFLPVTAPVLFPMLAAYNSIETIDSMAQLQATGRLSWGSVAKGVAQIGLNFLPYVGEIKLVANAGKVAMYTLEGVTIAGMSVLMTLDGVAQIRALRDKDITEIGRLDEEVRNLERTNPSDPTLSAKKAQLEGMIQQAQARSTEVIEDLAKSGAVMLVQMAALKGVQVKLEVARGGARVKSILEGKALVHAHNVAVGSPVPTATEAHAILDQLARGDHAAFRALGIETPPADFDLRSVEWGIGEQPDGSFLIVRGEPGAVDWSGFPGVRAVAHSHPLTAGKRLTGASVTFAELVKGGMKMEVNKVNVFPSAADVRFCAVHGLTEHTVQTPYVSKGGGQIGNPTPSGHEPLVSIKIRQPERAGSWGGVDDLTVYKTKLVAIDAGGNELWSGDAWTTEHPSMGSVVMFEEPGPGLMTKKIAGAAPAARTTKTSDPTRATWVSALPGQLSPDEQHRLDLMTRGKSAGEIYDLFGGDLAVARAKLGGSNLTPALYQTRARLGSDEARRAFDHKWNQMIGDDRDPSDKKIALFEGYLDAIEKRASGELTRGLEAEAKKILPGIVVSPPKAADYPPSWSSFDPARNAEFKTKLEAFRGTDVLEQNYAGGEGALYLGASKTTALKRWFAKRIGDMAASIAKLRSAHAVVSGDPALARYLDVVEIHEVGGDWIVRDFAAVSKELKNYASGPAEVARTEAIHALEARPSRSATEDDILGKLEGKSANLHWDPSRGKIVIIDMQ